MSTFDPQAYSIAWFCANQVEYDAARAALDQHHELPRDLVAHHKLVYSVGKVSDHGVVIAMLPGGVYNQDNIWDMRTTFSNLIQGLAVGMGGDLPRGSKIKPGDVVFGTPAVLSYVIEGQGIRSRYLEGASKRFLTAVTVMRGHSEFHGHDWLGTGIEKLFRDNDHLREYGLPVSHTNVSSTNLEDTCLDGEPGSWARTQIMHAGIIATGEGRIEDAQQRDEFAKKNQILCFAPGMEDLAADFPILPIRGICDIADARCTSKEQVSAAVAAAVVAKRLLGTVPAAIPAAGRIMNGIYTYTFL